MQLNYWTPEEDKIIIDNYSTTKMKQIHKLLPHRTFSALKHRKKVLKLKKRNFTSVNENFFEIPNLLNCYVAGFVAADGCLTTNDRFIINLSNKDYDFLKRIADIIGFKGTIHISEKERFFNFRKKPIYCKGKFCALYTWNTQKWTEDLFKNWNITPRKTYTLQPPNLTDLDLILAFICGNIDGDGSIIQNKNNRCIFKYNLHINMLGTQSLMEWIRSELNKININFNNQIKKHPKAEVYYYNICGSNAYLLSKMILSLNLPCMERKWDKARHLINLMETTPLTNEKRANLRRLIMPNVIEFFKVYNQVIPNCWLNL